MYVPTWSSVDRHIAAPEWFQDAKFGIFFHWGVFSVPAFGNEWYPRNMYLAGSDEHRHHVARYGDPSVWPYHNFINGAWDKEGNWTQFAPRLASAGGNFDPEEWAQLFADAGARFAGPVAEHHDGYSMWDSTVNEWNSVRTGPKLDLLGLFAEAIRGRRLKLLAAMHHAYHFTGYFEHVPAQSEETLRKLYGQLDPAAQNRLWLAKLREVVDGYQPDILWQDFELVKVDEDRRLEFLAHYYNQALAWNRNVVTNYKDGLNNRNSVFDYERGGPAEIQRPYCLTHDSISATSWCHTAGLGYYSLNTVVHSLIDRVSKDCTLLLNIAPAADGSIPAEQRDILLGIGDYLGRFGESIYATRAWVTHGEGPTRMGGGSFVEPGEGTGRDIRFTRNKAGTVLYATALGWPGRTLTISTLGANRIDLATLTGVRLLGTIPGAYLHLPHHQDASGLHIQLPWAEAPFPAPAYVVQLAFSGQIPSLGNPPPPIGR